jgi:hypothetical protein
VSPSQAAWRQKASVVQIPPRLGPTVANCSEERAVGRRSAVHPSRWLLADASAAAHCNTAEEAPFLVFRIGTIRRGCRYELKLLPINVVLAWSQAQLRTWPQTAPRLPVAVTPWQHSRDEGEGVGHFGERVVGHDLQGAGEVGVHGFDPLGDHGRAELRDDRAERREDL